MKTTLSITAVLATAAGALAENITIPATNGSLPAAGANGCAPGYYPGSDTVLFTVPYTYQQVLSIIGNYTNLTWSGSPPNSVTTNNSQALTTNDWTPGTARFYDISGAHVIETITTYSKPATGPYVEIHTLAPLTVAAANVSFYSDFDGQVWKPICNGQATWSNFTINYCATNATTAGQVLHMLHSTDAMTVGTFLGGQNFTSCGALAGGNGTASPSAYGGGNGTGSSGPSATSSPIPYTGDAVGRMSNMLFTGAVATVVVCVGMSM
ncbi:hypothetical protein B0A55_06004 [Friedmanniomyces simplex]|uniref:F5/8 type C domain-containing protein n=1 Tax=Friedmanniomyces simplex TaxID=329884 RepID=A0A4U0XG36_9PEZI|nr:hypothetical protein B0A55_06004 [Friedmanniomyces simplex]